MEKTYLIRWAYWDHGHETSKQERELFLRTSDEADAAETVIRLSHPALEMVDRQELYSLNGYAFSPCEITTLNILCQHHELVQAIKHVQACTRSSLSEAKEFFDALLQEHVTGKKGEHSAQDNPDKSIAEILRGIPRVI